jgi:hypothetical protein
MDTVTGPQALFAVDVDAQNVLEFMQRKIQASRLIGVADMLPQIARLLWSQHPQEPCTAASLVVPKPTDCDLSRQGANVLSLAQ